MNILVTGGASGLGQAITERLALGEQDFVYFTYCHSKASATKIEGKCKNTKALHLDFTDEESVSDLLNLLVELDIEVLVNNALTSYAQGYFHSVNPEMFERAFICNVMPTVKITQKFIEARRKKRFGRIVTILSSVLINKPPIGLSEYTANKAYLHSLCKSWAVENARYGITSNTISPSFMMTGLTKDTDTDLVDRIIEDNPNKELLRTEEAADSVHYLIHASPQINGVNLVLNAASDID